MKKKICLLGSTGSVGVQCLSVCEELGIKVIAIAAKKNIKLLEEQARKFNVKKVCVFEEKYYETLKENLKDCFCEVVCGLEGIFKICQEECDVVLNAIVGIEGLFPTVFALEAKKNVALANKETLVTAGELILKLAEKNGCEVLPVDSEHSAIFQCIRASKKNEVKSLILTASGGPFLGKTREFLKNVTKKEALKHPNWKMGEKITIDSATLMNKGLELIEAVKLFKKKPEEIVVVVHPQSVLHSAVEFVDGAILGQFSVPTMKLAIQYALTYPNRVYSKIKPFKFTDYLNLSFLKPDNETFPCIKFCEIAAKRGGLFPTILNAVNEKAVELFLNGEIEFLDIEKAVENSLKIELKQEEFSVSTILKTDKLIKENFNNILKMKKLEVFS